MDDWDDQIDFDRIILEAEFRPYFDYIEFMEKFLDAEQKKLNEFITIELKKWGRPNIDMMDLQAMGIFPEKILELSGLLRDSFFISLYAYFENKLIRECRERKTDQVLIDFDDIRGPDVIERVRKYFTKVLRMDFPSNTQEWELIQNYRIIRNCIVHARGRIDEIKDQGDRGKLQRFVNKHQNISLFREEEDPIAFAKANGEIYLHGGFCEEACKTIEEFLTVLLFD